MSWQDRRARGTDERASRQEGQHLSSRARLSPWGRLVLFSALLLAVTVGGLALADVGSTRERLVSYPVGGSVDIIRFDIADADIAIVGAGSAASVEVERRERFSFGHAPVTGRSVTAGVFAVRSRCPTSLPGSCEVRYRVRVPDNVAVDVRTSGGSVRFIGYRGSARVATTRGDVDIAGFCGFSLQVRAATGDVRAAATCPPQQLSLRTTSGSIRAIVPAGRYRIDAQSASGGQSGRGLEATTDAPYAIQLLSSTGDVGLERSP